MSDLRYNRAFKKALYGIFICIILFGSIIVFFIISKLQYDQLVSDMKPMDATIVDIDLDVHIKGPMNRKYLLNTRSMELFITEN